MGAKNRYPRLYNTTMTAKLPFLCTWHSFSVLLFWLLFFLRQWLAKATKITAPRVPYRRLPTPPTAILQRAEGDGCTEPLDRSDLALVAWSSVLGS